MILVLISCNNNEIKKLKEENKYLLEQSKIDKSDSISIFNSILKDNNRKFSVKFLDSLKNVDLQKYDAILNESYKRKRIEKDDWDDFDEWADWYMNNKSELKITK